MAIQPKVGHNSCAQEKVGNVHHFGRHCCCSLPLSLLLGRKCLEVLLYIKRFKSAMRSNLKHVCTLPESESERARCRRRTAIPAPPETPSWLAARQKQWEITHAARAHKHVRDTLRGGRRPAHKTGTAARRQELCPRHPPFVCLGKSLLRGAYGNYSR